MDCPFCKATMTPVPGRQAAEVLADMLIAKTSPMYGMVKGAISGNGTSSGAHCNSSQGCGYFALFVK